MDDILKVDEVGFFVVEFGLVGRAICGLKQSTVGNGLAEGIEELALSIFGWPEKGFECGRRGSLYIPKPPHSGIDQN